ncbi:MAG TPA: hypothetical protein VI636_07605 [Candidatus Angelobacter sp.]
MKDLLSPASGARKYRVIAEDAKTELRALAELVAEKCAARPNRAVEATPVSSDAVKGELSCGNLLKLRGTDGSLKPGAKALLL